MGLKIIGKASRALKRVGKFLSRRRSGKIGKGFGKALTRTRGQKVKRLFKTAFTKKAGPQSRFGKFKSFFKRKKGPSNKVISRSRRTLGKAATIGVGGLGVAGGGAVLARRRFRRR